MEQSSFKGLWGTGGLSKGALSVGSATARSPMASSSKPRLRPALHTWEGEPPSHSGPKWRLHCGREARSIITSRRCAQGALPRQVDVAPVPGQTRWRKRQGATERCCSIDVEVLPSPQRVHLPPSPIPFTPTFNSPPPSSTPHAHLHLHSHPHSNVPTQGAAHVAREGAQSAPA